MSSVTLTLGPSGPGVPGGPVSPGSPLGRTHTLKLVHIYSIHSYRISGLIR